MRRLGWLLLGLLLLGWMACLVPARLPEVADGAIERASSWRRTTIGWERCDAWPTALPERPIAPHPILLLGGQMIAVGVAGVLAGGAMEPRRNG